MHSEFYYVALALVQSVFDSLDSGLLLFTVYMTSDPFTYGVAVNTVLSNLEYMAMLAWQVLPFDVATLFGTMFVGSTLVRAAQFMYWIYSQFYKLWKLVPVISGT